MPGGGTCIGAGGGAAWACSTWRGASTGGAAAGSSPWVFLARRALRAARSVPGFFGVVKAGSLCRGGTQGGHSGERRRDARLWRHNRGQVHGLSTRLRTGRARASGAQRLRVAFGRRTAAAPVGG